MSNNEGFAKYVPKINEDKGYWFVRTDGGKFFEEYTSKDYIGIGWNEVTLTDMRNKTSSDIKHKIAQTFGYNEELKKGKGKITSIYNKILRFEALREGDLIIVPSVDSRRLAFGEIQDQSIYTEVDDIVECPYYKRRRVKWLRFEEFKSLDNVFFNIKKSRHSISDIKKYSKYIDVVTNSLFFKNDSAHFVLDITTNEEINIDELVNLITKYKEIVNSVNEFYNLHEDVQSASIRLNLQSPGNIEFKQFGMALAIASIILVSFSCGSPVDAQDQQMINQFTEENRQTLEEVDQLMDSLNVNKEKIREFY